MIDIINRLLWLISSIFLFLGGLYFTFFLKFKQFNFRKMLNIFFSKSINRKASFQSLMISLGARIGVGSLAGVALAICYGGVGSIFWFWVSSFILSINTYVECFLAIKYKDNNVGGPAFYIKSGLGNKNLAIFYAVLVILAYVGGFLTIQANTISTVLKSFDIPSFEVGIFISLISFIIVLKGLKGIVSIIEILVPFMCLLYIIVGGVIIFNNFDRVPNMFSNIISSAFNVKAFSGGILNTFIIGVQRSVFATESGIGTSAIAVAASSSDDANVQGLLQIMGAHFTSLIICTFTAFIIILSNYNGVPLDNINGIELTLYAFKYHLGPIGNIILTTLILLFSFSTIISGYYYGESNVKFLFWNNSKVVFIFKIIMAVLLFCGCVASANLFWNIVDILVAMMAIINIKAIFRLKDVVIEDSCVL